MLERGFARQIESKVARLYKVLLGRLAEGSAEIILTPKEYGEFCYSIAIQYTRVPSFRDKMELFIKMRGEQLFDQLVEKQRQDGTLPDEIEKILQNDMPQIIIEDFGTIKPMLEAAMPVSNALMDKTPGFFRSATGSYFFTSDNPVSYYVKNFEKYDIRQVEPVHPDAEVFFPINRTNAVVFFPHKSGYGSTRHAIGCKCLDFLSSGVKFINSRTVIMAKRYVYTSERVETLANYDKE